MNRMRREQGFTLLELMLVLQIIAILLILAVPNIIQSRINANETSAAASVRVLSVAQAAYKAAVFKDLDHNGEGDYAHLNELADPNGLGNSAPFIDEHLSSGRKTGYLFTALVFVGNGASPPAYICYAFPVRPLGTGVKIFRVDDSTVIRLTRDGTLPGPDSQPLT